MRRRFWELVPTDTASAQNVMKGDQFMKLAVSSSGKDLDAQIDPRFGRCSYFLIIDTEDMSYEAFGNENATLSGGAGIQSAQVVASKGVGALITGHCGPNAVQALTAAGIKFYVGQTGTVRESVESYKNGKLTLATEANAPSHTGMGGGGRGKGMGGRGSRGGRGASS